MESSAVRRIYDASEKSYQYLIGRDINLMRFRYRAFSRFPSRRQNHPIHPERGKGVAED